MAKTKTTYTGQDITDFLNSFVGNEQMKAYSYQLIDLLQKWTDSEPKMWGPSIIGFGKYHYKYASGHEGDAPVLAFSPRKAALTLYVYSDTEKSRKLLPYLGKFKKSKSCIYIKKLADINTDILKEICIESIKYISEHHECSCRVKNSIEYELQKHNR
ncbi:MAG: DUF1801 domain-containing protein [Cytophagales bacterium]|nr:DUF1801 domain-containing protein [Cytophagales bacterium]MDW8385362.1 DUF1801 domain-containing protein [Flammeovirgaceae bacterium]